MCVKCEVKMFSHIFVRLKLKKLIFLCYFLHTEGKQRSRRKIAATGVGFEIERDFPRIQHTVHNDSEKSKTTALRKLLWDKRWRTKKAIDYKVIGR